MYYNTLNIFLLFHRQLDGTIKQSCSAEIQKKYSTYIGDLEKVTKLLLNLSRKLTKVDSILHDLKEDNKENRVSLMIMQLIDAMNMHEINNNRTDCQSVGLVKTMDHH